MPFGVHFAILQNKNNIENTKGQIYITNSLYVWCNNNSKINNNNKKALGHNYLLYNTIFWSKGVGGLAYNFNLVINGIN